MAQHFDYIAIGGGSCGIASANRAAMYGKKVALIEAKELGGTCVNVGCVPKKIMVNAAEYGMWAEDAGAFGWDIAKGGFDLAKLAAPASAARLMLAATSTRTPSRVAPGSKRAARAASRSCASTP